MPIRYPPPAAEPAAGSAPPNARSSAPRRPCREPRSPYRAPRSPQPWPAAPAAAGGYMRSPGRQPGLRICSAVGVRTLPRRKAPKRQIVSQKPIPTTRNGASPPAPRQAGRAASFVLIACRARVHVLSGLGQRPSRSTDLGGNREEDFILVVKRFAQERDELGACAGVAQCERDGGEPPDRVEPDLHILVLELVDEHRNGVEGVVRHPAEKISQRDARCRIYAAQQADIEGG